MINEGLSKYQEESKQETYYKVCKALTNLKKGKKKITYKLVAEKANVSEAILYKTPEIMERIKQAKEIQKQKLSGSQVIVERYKSPKDKKIKELQEQIVKYREKVSELENINALLLGELEESTNEILDLQTRLKARKQAIKFKE